MDHHQHYHRHHNQQQHHHHQFEKIALIGCGSIGRGIALLFAEKGLDVSIHDRSSSAMDFLVSQAFAERLGHRIHKFTEFESLVASLCSGPRLIIFCLPYGHIADKVLASLFLHLEPGDIILDAGNEHFANTERRQSIAGRIGIRYVGVGVSGGYQAARSGPSLCPSGEDETLDMIMPLLNQVAAKDRTHSTSYGMPSVAKAGRAGCGHYIKMVHNTIEHSMMSAICEAWQIMQIGLDMELDEIADTLQRWNHDNELKGTLLVKMSEDICRMIDPKTNHHALPTMLDKVVQDMTEEGSAVWSALEAVSLHIPVPTLTDAHYLRVASSYHDVRQSVHRAFDGGFKPARIELSGQVKADVLWNLRIAVYTVCLAAYVQGINVIEAANKKHGWNVNFAALWQIWRAGCTIQAEQISDLIKPALYEKSHEVRNVNLMLEPEVAKELRKGHARLKHIMMLSIEADLSVPSMGATLEWLKYETNTDLPTSFYEAHLDYVGGLPASSKAPKGVLPKAREVSL